MLDLLLDPTTGDIVYQNGEITLVRDTKKIVRQELEITLRTFIGEWFNNVQFGGINRAFLGQTGISKIAVDAFYRSVILSNPDVLEILEFESTLNPITRAYDLSFVVRTNEGPVDLILTDASNEQTYPEQDSDVYLPPTTPQIKSTSAFIQGSSTLSAFFTSATHSLVALPIEGASSLSAAHTKILVPVTLTGESELLGVMYKVFEVEALEGSDSITANLTKIGSATMVETTPLVVAQMDKAFVSGITNTSTVAGTFHKVLSASITGTSSLVADANKAYNTLITGDSNIAASLNKVLGASLSGDSDFTATFAKVGEADIASSSSISALLARVGTGDISGVSSVTAAPTKVLGASVTNNSSISANMYKRFGASVSGGVSTVNAYWTYTSNAALEGQGYLLASATKIKSSSSTISNTSSVSANLTRIKYASANINNNTSSMTAEIVSLEPQWTSATVSPRAWKDVIYANGQFTAISSGGGSDSVANSADGETWTNVVGSSTASEWQSIAYGNGIYVAVASSGSSRIMTSPDAVNWTLRTAPANNNWQSVCFANGLFVAVASSGTNRVMTSTNGTSWTLRNAINNNVLWNSVAGGGGNFVATASFGADDRVMTSTNGINWTSSFSSDESLRRPWQDATYDPTSNRFYILNNNSPTTNDQLYYTPDGGSSWLATLDELLPSGHSPTSIAVDSTDRRVVVNHYDNLVFESDGSGFESVTINNTDSFSKVAHNGAGKFVAVSYYLGGIMYKDFS